MTRPQMTKLRLVPMERGAIVRHLSRHQFGWFISTAQGHVPGKCHTIRTLSLSFSSVLLSSHVLTIFVSPMGLQHAAATFGTLLQLEAPLHTSNGHAAAAMLVGCKHTGYSAHYSRECYWKIGFQKVLSGPRVCVKTR
jgi:hypothetical protein